MYFIEKRMEVAGAHQLKLDYDSPCQNLHGHNWIITVTVGADLLDRNGMVLDFKKIKDLGCLLDHHNIGDVLGMNPTAENMAHWFKTEIEAITVTARKKRGLKVLSVRVQESEGNVIWYLNEKK